MTKTFHLIWEFLCSRDIDNNHLAMFRTAAVRPITGHPIAGWKS